jgi:hypothetical protein
MGKESPLEPGKNGGASVSRAVVYAIERARVDVVRASGYRDGTFFKKRLALNILW